MSTTQDREIKEWTIATASAEHLTGDASCLIDPTPTIQAFISACGKVTATLTGSVELQVESSTGTLVLRLAKVFLVPGLPRGMISTESLRPDYYYENFTPSLFETGPDGKVTVSIVLQHKDGLDYLPIVRDEGLGTESRASSVTIAAEEEGDVSGHQEIAQDTRENGQQAIALNSSYYARAD